MASSAELTAYIAEQFSGAGEITYKKMFGEYGLYCGGKFFAMVCDDRLFVKITEAGRAQFPFLPEDAPYDDAKNCFLIENPDDRDFLVRLAVVTCSALPDPKPRKKKSN